MIGTWKCNLLPCYKIITDRPTDQPTNIDGLIEKLHLQYYAIISSMRTEDQRLQKQQTLIRLFSPQHALCQIDATCFFLLHFMPFLKEKCWHPASSIKFAYFFITYACGSFDDGSFVGQTCIKINTYGKDKNKRGCDFEEMSVISHPYGSFDE